jgi:enolase
MNKLMLLKVFDSRGNETIEATMLFKNNSRLSSIAPAGKSTGIHEVGTFPLTNGKPDINKSIEFFNLHKNKIEDAFEFDKQKDFDDLLKSIDGTNNLSNIGGSLSISLSMLFLKYKAYQKGLEIYEYLNSNAKEKDIPKHWEMFWVEDYIQTISCLCKNYL